MRRRTILIVAVVVVLVPVVVLAVEVQIARNATRLDDEVGFRPTDLTIRAGPEPTTVVWLGDSTATGVGVDDVSESMAYEVTEAVVEGPVELTILAVSGAQVHEVVDNQIPALDQTNADVVFVSVGANDVTGLTRAPTFRRRYRRLVESIRAAVPDASIVLVGIPDLGTAPRLPVPLRQIAGFRAAQLDGVIEDIAERRGIEHVDLAERTGSIFASDPDRYFSPDDFHPSPAGHQVWADAVIDAVGGT